MDFFTSWIFHEALRMEYKNELESMAAIKDLPFPKLHLEMKRVENLSKKDTAANLVMKSTNLREQGNKLFKASPTKNALAAARYYTKAIFAAPLGSEALALAHANRATALQQFGYFSQAYDDCICALEQGYPMHKHHKLILRQGYCALQLGDMPLLEQHLDTLNESTLNENFTLEVEKLRKGLNELQLKKQKVGAPEKQIALYRDKVKILKSSTKGRFMVASKSIKRNELIFSERASTFIPSVGSLICQQCASTQLIPFPCYRCSGKVVYCSVKCRREHAITHGYECMAYQLGLFPTSGDIHLGLRVMLDGIQQVIPFLHFKRTAEEIWHELTDNDSELLQKEHLEYVQVLHRVSHLDKKPKDMIHAAARNSRLMIEYLKLFTNFFNIFKDTAATRSDWELIIGSLILRHMFQNGANSIEIGYMRHMENAETFEFELLDDDLWNRPLLVRRGSLHKKFRGLKEAFTANYPYLGLMNHSCESSVEVKFMGRCLSAFAVKNIKSNEEISLNYLSGERFLPKQSRKVALKERFHFECNCSKCSKENQTEGEIYHRYRCEYSKCRSTFTLPASDDLLNWWEYDDGAHNLCCPKCNNMQMDLLACLFNIEVLLESGGKSNSLVRVFKTYKHLDHWLLDKHLLKYVTGRKIVEKCLVAYNAGSPLSKNDFAELAKICEHLMSYDLGELNYVYPMSLLWDIMALKKYKSRPEEMREMLQKVEILSYEIKNVCMNYYNEYIH